MSKKQNDLRVKKTERSIRQTFDLLIREKPLSKISVTEIARLAEINKGTFYLHYKDIYDLYDSFVRENIQEWLDGIDFLGELISNPESFTNKFFNYIKHSPRFQNMEFYYVTDDTIRLPIVIAEELQERIYQSNPIERTLENNIKLECIFGVIIDQLFTHSSEERLAAFQKVSITAIKAFFPQGDAQP